MRWDQPARRIGEGRRARGIAERVQHFSEVAGVPQIVGIDRRDKRTGRCRDTRIARRRYAAIVPVDDCRARIVAGECGGNRARAVGRSVVDDD